MPTLGYGLNKVPRGALSQLRRQSATLYIAMCARFTVSVPHA
jgi:hypothetical protein